MPRVYRQRKSKAGADRHCGVCGIKIEPGMEYLSWSFRYGGSRYRCAKHPPRRSDLTQSKMATVYGAIEQAEDQAQNITSHEEAEALVQEVAAQVREVAEEYEEAAEAFDYQGPNQERYEELDAWADELDSFMPAGEDPEAMDGESDEDRQEAIQELRDEVTSAFDGCPL